MKTPYLGKNGHVAIGTLSVERAAAYLAGKGIATRPETEKRGGDGSLANVYLDVAIGGFAFHLFKK
jgi:2-dehydro-3-deoxyphosphogluconate aldolase/(4S)-4-hydroxy-2-oxoglutarate aldolase